MMQAKGLQSGKPLKVSELDPFDPGVRFEIDLTHARWNASDDATDFFVRKREHARRYIELLEARAHRECMHGLIGHVPWLNCVQDKLPSFGQPRPELGLDRKVANV
jgi:hypothetical protein